MGNPQIPPSRIFLASARCLICAGKADQEVSELDTNQQVDHYWNAVFQLKSIDGNSRYQCQPLVIKSRLVFAQTNAESESSLLINARVVTSEWSALEK